MQREIGSNFDLNPNIFKNEENHWSLENLGLFGADSVLMSTGRSAQALVIDEVEQRNPSLQKKVLIPSFTCETVIEPFITKGYEISTYSINEKLNVNRDIFEKEVLESNASIVLIHQYFGFQTMKGLDETIYRLSAKGIVFIEDRTQCLYSDFAVLPVDYIVGSIRKWSCLPDGGFAICCTGKFKNKPTHCDTKLEYEKIEAFKKKYSYLHQNLGSKEEYLNLLKKAEHTLENQNEYYLMSESAIKIQKRLNIEELKKKRILNYNYLYNHLIGIENINIITPKIYEDEVPLYIMCLVSNRDEFQFKLSENQIYAPIVWEQSIKYHVEICNVAQELYNSGICIPIDQRYDIDDMERIISCIEEIL